MSVLFGSSRPRKPHLVSWKSGVAGEVHDLRRDVETAFTLLDSILTPEGGLALRLINDTGAASVKGTIVDCSTSMDEAFEKSNSVSDHPIGVVYEDGIANGSPCLVVQLGRAQVLLKDSTASTHGNWVQTSNVDGRADATLAGPNPATHWGEVGHSLESKAGGTNVLFFCMLHFN